MGNSTWPPSIQIGVTAGIFLAAILLKEMRYLVYIRYLCFKLTTLTKLRKSCILPQVNVDTKNADSAYFLQGVERLVLSQSMINFDLC